MLVEDHSLLVESMSVALVAGGVEVVRPAALDEGEILATAVRERPDVVLLDLWLSDGACTEAMIPELVATGATVVMLTAETDQAALGRCLEAGAAGIVAKTDSFDTLLAAVDRAEAGEAVLSSARRHTLLASAQARRRDDRARMARFRSLTARECELLEALVEGHSAETIAGAWVVSLATVRSHIRSLLRKLGVSTQLAAVAAARTAGWSRD